MSEVRYGNMPLEGWNNVHNRIQLNVCPSSNVMLGYVKDYRDHPIRILVENGVRVTINTDDLLIFDSSIERKAKRTEKARSSWMRSGGSGWDTREIPKPPDSRQIIRAIRPHCFSMWFLNMRTDFLCQNHRYSEWIHFPVNPDTGKPQRKQAQPPVIRDML